MVKRERETFLHISQIRGTIKKFAVVLAFVCAFVFMLLSKSENVLIEKTSGTAGEIVSSAVDVLVMPAAVLVKGYEYLRSLRKIDLENRALREENRRLTIANAENRQLVMMSNHARALEIENKLLSNLLNYTPPPEASFVTAKVVAEEGGAFAHAITVYTAGSPVVRKGQVVVGNKGVIGRVEKTGADYAKIFLVNDINSKIPVMTEKSRIRGVLAGENDLLPKMVFIPLDAGVKVGDRIITSGIGGVFPAGLPVGKVVSVDREGVKVRPFDNLSSLEYVQIVDYKLPDPALVFSERDEAQ